MKLTRRSFFRKTALESAVLAFPLALTGSNNAIPINFPRPIGPTHPTPTKGQITWQGCAIRLICLFDISAAVSKFQRHNNDYKGTFYPREYYPLKFDTDQWISACTASGAKYAIFTGTHFKGFLQWQSDAYPYSHKFEI